MFTLKFPKNPEIHLVERLVKSLNSFWQKNVNQHGVNSSDKKYHVKGWKISNPYSVLLNNKISNKQALRIRK